MRQEQKIIRYFVVVPPGSADGSPGTYRIPVDKAGTPEARRAFAATIRGATMIRTDDSVEVRL